MAYIAFETKYNAASYQTNDLLQDLDSSFAQAYNTSGNTYTGTFNDSNLVAGVLTVTHSLNTGFPKPMIRRPNGTYEDAISLMTYVSVNQVTFNFGGSIAAGTWNIQIRS